MKQVRIFSTQLLTSSGSGVLAQKCYLRCAVSEAKLIWDVIRITPQSLCCLGISCEAVTYALVWSSGFRPRTEKGVIGHRDTEPREKWPRISRSAEPRPKRIPPRTRCASEKM